MTSPQPSESGPGRTASLLIANVSKLVAVGMGVNEAFVRHDARPVVIGLAALFFAGVQGVELLISRLLGK
jgi:hypothetical protein